MSEPAFPGTRGEFASGNCTFRINANGDSIPIEHNQGMTLLDYFAGQALVGVLAERDCDGLSNERLAEVAYDLGKAMLEEKAKRERAG